MKRHVFVIGWDQFGSNLDQKNCLTEVRDATTNAPALKRILLFSGGVT
jgi:hypothetical protein